MILKNKSRVDINNLESSIKTLIVEHLNESTENFKKVIEKNGLLEQFIDPNTKQVVYKYFNQEVNSKKYYR